MVETALVPGMAVLGVIGLFLIGGFVLLVMMLANPKTRAAGAVLVVRQSASG